MCYKISMFDFSIKSTKVFLKELGIAPKESCLV